MSCVCHVFAPVHYCLVVTWRERADLLALVCDAYCDFVTFPFGILGQVWYLIVSIPDPCCLPYWKRFTPSSKIFYWPFQGGTSFVDVLCFFCLVFAMPLCASVYLCLVVTCWEKADPWLSFVMSNCEFVTFPLVFLVRCGTWLYRFLIVAPLLTSTDNICKYLGPWPGPTCRSYSGAKLSVFLIEL